MRSLVRRSRGERGSGPVTVIMVLGFLALLAGVLLTGAGGAASVEQSQAQDAADAAALAGAGYILDDLPDQLLSAPFADPGTLPGGIGEAGCVQLGEASAAELAGENDAKLTSYCWSSAQTEVTVTVQLDHSVRGQPAQARAVAAPGFSLSDCTIDPSFVPPTPTPTPPATPPTKGGGNGGEKGGGGTKPAPPPAPITTTVNCGFGDLEVTYDPTTKLFTFTDPDAVRALLDDLKPRLDA